MKSFYGQRISRLLLTIFITSILLPLYGAEPVLNPTGIWSITAKSPYSENAAIYFYFSFKKNVENKWIVDIERSGGFFQSKNIPVRINAHQWSFTHKENDREFHFTAGITKTKIKGEYVWKDNTGAKGKYSFTGNKMAAAAPVRDMSGNYEFLSGRDDRLMLTMNGNSITGFLVLKNNTRYPVTGNVLGSQIVFYRFGYDWYELFVAETTDKGIHFKGKIILNDRQVKDFTMKNITIVIPPPPAPAPKPTPVVFTPPVVSNWFPQKKCRWGGHLILERGRMIIWWLDTEGIAHPIFSKRILEKYGESMFNVNFAPRNIRYAAGFKVGIAVDDERSPDSVKGKIWKDAGFTFNPQQGSVIMEEGTDRLWYINGEMAHWIENEKTFLKHWQDKSKIRKVSYGYLNGFILGPNIMEN